MRPPKRRPKGDKKSRNSLYFGKGLKSAAGYTIIHIKFMHSLLQLTAYSMCGTTCLNTHSLTHSPPSSVGEELMASLRAFRIRDARPIAWREVVCLKPLRNQISTIWGVGNCATLKHNAECIIWTFLSVLFDSSTNTHLTSLCTRDQKCFLSVSLANLAVY